MNGEVPSVPITTLAGITSLTELLSELPLPTPLPNVAGDASLLYNKKLIEQAQTLLASNDTTLVQQLAHVLRQNSTDHIELKDNHGSDISSTELPNLLQAILVTHPDAFKEGLLAPNAKTTGTKKPCSQFSPQHASRDIAGQYAGPASPCVQSSFPSQSAATDYQCFQQYSQPKGSTEMNGEHFDMEPSTSSRSRVRAQRHSGPIMNSPAQATVAETAVRQTVPRATDRNGSTRKPAATETIELLDDSDEEAVVARRSRSRDAHSRDTRSEKHESKPKSDTWADTMKAVGGACRKPVVMLEPLDPKTLNTIALGGGSVRTEKRGNDRRGSKRRRDDVVYLDFGDGYSSLSDRVKRRKRANMEDDEYDSDDEETELLRRKKKDKRQKRMNQTDLSVEELLDSPTFKKFSTAMEYIFDSAEDVNFGSLDPNDEEVECPPESLISKTVLAELTSETAKLKSMGVLNQVPADRLVKLLTILQWNIRDGTKLIPSGDMDEDEDADAQELWREIAMERVSRSMDAALTASYIITAPKMPKQVFQDDVIERIISFGKFQLQNTIYPEFDPVYRLNPNKTGYHGSLKLKRAHARQVKHKSTIALYNKLSDLVGNLAELVEIQELTDSVILQISTMGVSPFFVENISELQLNAMKLVTTVFAHYDKHRQLVLEDIFASLARLPSSKRNLRSYRLTAEEHIQMVTALALQLIQCVVKLPQPPDPDQPPEEEEVVDDSHLSPKARREKARHGKRKSGPVDPEIVVVTSYEKAMRTGYNFLSVFLKRCTMKGEDDYRPLFENFVQDLLSTVNKPEWPASELLLSLLGRILVKQFSNKSVDMPLRTASLEYLGIVAARLRKDAISSSSQLNQETINDILHKVHEDVDEVETDQVSEKKSTRNSDAKTPEPKPTEEKDETEDLQSAMLDYLAFNGQSEPAYLFARQFYIAQWFRDTTKEALKKNEHDDFDAEEDEKTTETMTDIEKRTQFLMCRMQTNYKPFSSYQPSASKLDYDSACLVARYLSSKRPFAQSFDIYLGQILKVLSENVTAVRTKAMKCLTAVVEADPGVLARPDMERGVHGRFMDSSTSVREAAIELVGKFILIRPELIPQYYDMLSERILDTGISVRKRVIKIFREIMIVQPDLKCIPDMCVKMIRRVNDEEGIKKLITEVFQTMWFVPLSMRDKDSSKLLQRVVNVTEVVAASKDTGYEFIEQLLDSLLKKDEHGNHNKAALTSCRQIVDCLVENVLMLEERSAEGRGCSQRLMACLSTLYLFSKIKPELMVQHVQTLQPYLEIKCSNPGDYYVLHYVARILELVIPLMEHPSDTFLLQIEEDMIKLILNHGMMVVESCVSCLGAVVNTVTHNYSLVKDCFQKFFGYLSKYQVYQSDNPTKSIDPKRKPTLLRSLFTVGLLCKHFDFDSKDMGETKTSIKDTVFDVLVYFTTHQDEDVRLKAMTGLGFMAVRHYEFMLGRTLKNMYCDLLMNDNPLIALKCQALKNLLNYLVEEEVKMAKSDAEWKKHAKEEDLKEMGDVQSGMASTIMQVYLKHVLESFFTDKSQVRLEALNVIHLILRQGLIHPVQCVPYLISMGTDTEHAIRVKADQQLQDIEKKYPGFIHMKALQGIKMCFRLQSCLQKNHNDGVIRGMRNPDDNCSSLNAFLYTVLRTNRSHRRAILSTLLNLLDDSAKIGLQEQLYIVDNLAFFVYQTQDEPLFIIHQIDIIVSVSGSNLLQSFRERLELKLAKGSSKMEKPKGRRTRSSSSKALPPMMANGEVEQRGIVYDDDDDDKETLLQRLPAEVAPLKDIILLAQGCILLLYLKQHLKDMYGFTDSKIQNYSPTEAAKVYDKPLQRKALVKFNPESVLTVMKQKDLEGQTAMDDRLKLVDDYLQFKDLMLSVDPPDEDDSDGAGHRSPGRTTTATTASPADPGTDPVTTAVPGLPITNGEVGAGEDVDQRQQADVIVLDGEGDASHTGTEKESPSSVSETVRPRIPPVIINTSKLNTPVRDKDRDKKRGSLVRTIRLPGASQLQASAHKSSPSVHSQHSSSHHSPHHSSHSRSHHHRSAPPKKRKKKQKQRRRYGSDNDSDDAGDSDYDPDC